MLNIMVPTSGGNSMSNPIVVRTHHQNMENRQIVVERWKINETRLCESLTTAKIKLTFDAHEWSTVFSSVSSVGIWLTINKRASGIIACVSDKKRLHSIVSATRYGEKE